MVRLLLKSETPTNISMELPPFDLLWHSSEKLLELESVLEEIDQNEVQKSFSKKRSRRDGLFGVGFQSQDRSYYEPQHFCCDQAFYTEDAYNSHVSTHLQCEVTGCSFVAHPDAMRLHTEVVHDSGYFDEVFRSTTDSSVKAWIEARKRNYPTLERAAVKQEILAERLARGQVFKTQEFGAMNRHRPPVITSNNSIHSTSKSIPTSIPTDFAIDQTCLQPESTVALTNTELGVTMSNSETPRLVSLDYDSETEDHVQASSCSSSDENNQDDGQSGSLDNNSPWATNNLKPPKDTLNCLSGEVNATSGAQNQVISVPRSRRRRRRGGRRRKHRAEQGDSDASTEECGVIHVSTDPVNAPCQHSLSPQSSNPFSSHPIVQLRAQRRACIKNPERIHSRPTLLQMLLAEEMRTERNQLMQCVRYVVKNNFFMDARSTDIS